MPVDFAGFAYAAAVGLGGILGYVKSNSIPSLGAGVVFGSALAYGAYRTSQDPNDYVVLLGTSAVLGGLMSYRFYNTGKIMPAGLITAISVAMIIRLTIRSMAPPIKVD